MYIYLIIRPKQLSNREIHGTCELPWWSFTRFFWAPPPSILNTLLHPTPLLTISVYFSQILQIPTHKAILQKAKALLLCKPLFPLLSLFPRFSSLSSPPFLLFSSLSLCNFTIFLFLNWVSVGDHSFSLNNRSHLSPSPHFRVLALRSEIIRQALFGFLCTTFEASESCLT